MPKNYSPPSNGDQSTKMATTSWVFANTWSLTGNTGTSSSTNFIGTTDSQPLNFRTNNVTSMQLDTSGNIHLGNVAASGILGSERWIINDTTGSQSDFCFVVASGGYPAINMGSSGGTPTARTASTAGNLCGSVGWYAYDGSSWKALATITAKPLSVATGSVPGELDVNVNGTTIIALTSSGATLNGAPAAATPSTSDSSTRIATTAWVHAQGYATSASSVLTGTPTAPTAALGTNTTQIATTAFVIANESIPPQCLYQSGSMESTECWYPAGHPTATASTTLALTAGRIYAIPFYIPASRTLDRLSFKLTTKSSGNYARIGLYSSAGGGSYYPTSLVYDSGSLSTSSTGIINNTTISLAVQNGLYWVVLLASSNPTVVGFAAATALPILGWSSTLTGSPNIGLYIAQTYDAFPATFASGATLYNGTYPALFARFSA